MCILDRPAIQTLGEGIKLNTSIYLLDFSYNNIEDRDSDILARIIRNKTLNRENMRWKTTLREKFVRNQPDKIVNLRG